MPGPLARLRRASAIFALSLAGHSALAHALLEHATPSVGGTVTVAPREVEIDFSETVEPAFCKIVVRNAAGARVDAGNVHVEAGDARRLVVGLEPLPPGAYTVTWQAVSTDTHKTQGHFSFSVAP